MLTIEMKTLGQRKGVERTIEPPAAEPGNDDRITVRQLIRAAVEDEFQRRADVRRAQERLEEDFLQALYAALLRERAVEQKPSAGAKRAVGVPALLAAITACWQAFVEQRYLLLVDGKRMRQLDELVRLHDDSRVTFIRRLEFVGG